MNLTKNKNAFVISGSVKKFAARTVEEIAERENSQAAIAYFGIIKDFFKIELA
jgi:hypothetical protein